MFQVDYDNLIITEEIEQYDEIVDFTYMRSLPCLKQEIIDWLDENVQDNNSRYTESDKSWCMGNDEYRSHDHSSVTLFFYRRSDAMKFIKRWSVHKKPTTYLNYFKDDYRELVNGKLIKKILY